MAHVLSLRLPVLPAVPAAGILRRVMTEAGAVLHANATRGRHFRELISKPVTLAIVAGLALAGGGIGFGVGSGAGIAAAIAGGLLLFALLIVFAIADSRAAEDFYRSYASARGLTTGSGRGHLPPATSLLRRGVRRYSERSFGGKLDGRVDGVLALYTYETETTDSKGNRQVQYHKFTVALVQVPGASAFLSQLAAQRRSGFRFLDKAEDVFRSRQRMEHESEILDKRFEIFIGKGDDLNRARQVFSPVFIDYLSGLDEKVGFEMEDGMLLVEVKGHHDEAEELDRLSRAAADIAERIGTEVAEAAPPGQAKAAVTFNPANFVPAGTESAKGTVVGWVIAGTIFLVIGGVIAGAIVLGSSSDDGADGDSGLEYDSATLQREDDTLMPLMRQLDDKNGVNQTELYGHGVPSDVVDEWMLDALSRGLIRIDSENFSYHVAPG